MLISSVVATVMDMAMDMAMDKVNITQMKRHLKKVCLNVDKISYGC